MDTDKETYIAKCFPACTLEINLIKIFNQRQIEPLYMPFIYVLHSLLIRGKLTQDMHELRVGPLQGILRGRTVPALTLD